MIERSVCNIRCSMFNCIVQHIKSSELRFLIVSRVNLKLSLGAAYNNQKNDAIEEVNPFMCRKKQWQQWRWNDGVEISKRNYCEKQTISVYGWQFSVWIRFTMNIACRYGAIYSFWIPKETKKTLALHILCASFNRNKKTIVYVWHIM